MSVCLYVTQEGTQQQSALLLHQGKNMDSMNQREGKDTLNWEKDLEDKMGAEGSAQFQEDVAGRLFLVPYQLLGLNERAS